VPEEYDLLLMTDQLDLPAETVALLYRWRWMIELFFRWLKCTVRFRHLLSESADGIQIQSCAVRGALLMYCALIATLLMMLS
jgi:IS4 transposase